MTEKRINRDYIDKIANVMSEQTQGEFFRQASNAIINASNGVDAIGIYSISGDVLLRDVNIKYKSETEQNKYYAFFGEYLQDWFGYLAQRATRDFNHPVYDEIGRLDYVRLSVGEKYFAITWLDKNRSVFLVAACWDKEKYINTTFEAAFRKITKDIRDRLQAIA